MDDTLLTETSGMADIATRKRTSAIAVRQSLGKRYAAERRFRSYGILALLFAFTMLVTLFAAIVGNGYSAFVQTAVKLDVHLDVELGFFVIKSNQAQVRVGDFKIGRWLDIGGADRPFALFFQRQRTAVVG